MESSAAAAADAITRLFTVPTTSPAAQFLLHTPTGSLGSEYPKALGTIPTTKRKYPRQAGLGRVHGSHRNCIGRLRQGQNRPGQKAELRARRVRHPHRRAVPL
eukprot:2279526-Pyramimonas_sp.AAC.1